MNSFTGNGIILVYLVSFGIAFYNCIPTAELRQSKVSDHYSQPIFITWKENHPLKAARFCMLTCQLSEQNV